MKVFFLLLASVFGFNLIAQAPQKSIRVQVVRTQDVSGHQIVVANVEPPPYIVFEGKGSFLPDQVFTCLETDGTDELACGVDKNVTPIGMVFKQNGSLGGDGVAHASLLKGSSK